MAVHTGEVGHILKLYETIKCNICCAFIKCDSIYDFGYNFIITLPAKCNGKSGMANY
jgi:hypothetical protein